MLKKTLVSINSVLDELINITKKDIEDIKKANHNALFERNIKKEELITQFSNLKSQIDNILRQRNEQNQILVNKDEEPLLEEFKSKIKEFHTLHTKFAKMAFTISNFYTNLLHKLTDAKPDIGYQMSPKVDSYNLSLKA
jgi:methionyl-tRNA formyltransferase